MDIKKTPGKGRLYVNTSQNVCLLLTGMGKSQATESFSAFLKSDTCKDLPPSRIINIGIAGCTSKAKSVGSAFQINKAYHHESNSHYSLKKLTNQNTSDLITVNEPCKNPSILPLKQNNFLLIDMELYHLINTYQQIIPVEEQAKCSSYKIISDHSSDEKINMKALAKTYDEKVTGFINEIEK